MLRLKSEIVQATKEFVALVGKQLDKNVRCFMSDNGTGYTSCCNNFSRVMELPSDSPLLTIQKRMGLLKP